MRVKFNPFRREISVSTHEKILDCMYKDMKKYLLHVLQTEDNPIKAGNIEGILEYVNNHRCRTSAAKEHLYIKTLFSFRVLDYENSTLEELISEFEYSTIDEAIIDLYMSIYVRFFGIDVEYDGINLPDPEDYTSLAYTDMVIDNIYNHDNGLIFCAKFKS